MGHHMGHGGALVRYLRVVVLLLCIVSLLLDFALAQKQCGDALPLLTCGLGYNTQNSCEAVGCCWLNNDCYVPPVLGYEVTTATTNSALISGNLTLLEPSDVFGQDVIDLTFRFTQETKSRAHIKITPSNGSYWEVPTSLLPRPEGIYSGDEAAFVMSFTQSPFEMYINRTANSQPTTDVIFHLTNALVIQEQYIQLVIRVPQGLRAVYGFGESSRHKQALQENTIYTLWNTDHPAAGFDASLYGSHPFYLMVMEDGTAHGAVLFNSNAMDITFDGNFLSIQTTGGVIDFYVFAGPSPSQVVQQYLQVIGRPMMVPYWSLGFHNCRWGYPDLAYVQDVVSNYSFADIPLETQWVDIDYMRSYLDFTVDPINFPLHSMQEFISGLHESQQYFVPILDPGIFALNTSYAPYARGTESRIFVNDLTSNTPYLGQVWPGPTVYPDWFAVNATSYWINELSEFYNQITYDGIWIDMNEVSNFCNVDGRGQVCVLSERPCDSNLCCLDCREVDIGNAYDNPPFLPHVASKRLGARTIQASAVHAGGVLEYNAHNLYGLMESIATNAGLQTIIKKRPFLLSRSTFIGSGAVTAHWTGDNAATWDDLAASIITMNNLALFGISMTGADICGFMEDTTEELCARWIEVGAFSPFSRDHNNANSIPQELYRWESVAEAGRNVLSLRYQLLPHLYTLMYLAHTSGATVHNALWMHFPSDPNCFSQDGQYMWSDNVLFIPVLEGGARNVTGYFPSSVWYPLMGNLSSPIDTTAGGKYLTLSTPLTTTNVFVRGGAILLMQESAMTTHAARQTFFTLVAALDADGSASGQLYLDDGEQLELNDFSFITYIASRSTISSTVVNSSYVPNATLQNIIVKGVTVQNAASCSSSLYFEDGRKTQAVSISYDDQAQSLKMVFDTTRTAIVSDYTVKWTCNKHRTSSADSWASLSLAARISIIIYPVLGVTLLAYFLVRRRNAMLQKAMDNRGDYSKVLNP